VAKQYGITPSAVSQIATGVRWGHAGGPLTKRREMTEALSWHATAEVLGGRTRRSVAAEFGFEESTIAYRVRRNALALR